MARTELAVGEGSQGGRGRRGRPEGGRYARYTEEQIEVLERVYAECSNPNHYRRVQIMREQPILRGINNKQLKVWFQNRRHSCNSGSRVSLLTVEELRFITLAWLGNHFVFLGYAQPGYMNAMTFIPNHLFYGTECLSNGGYGTKHSILTSTITTYNLSRQPEADDPQLPIRIGDNNSLLSLAEETKKESSLKSLELLLTGSLFQG
ncbi:UNVERIFIED_CONTAM: Homeobox-leucine zipper protein HOX9 [Sesamum calycinum]|uniref:Homeobox-leucine zipper protein HOX9 n=1 Tax=Sesamum calycinum TaxID=2727403 RepID=A0AAW2RT74_9LAMI